MVFRQLLFVSWVALLLSCNIKLAVSESSQLSVSLVVLACRAAHLCLLDKTCSTVPREKISSPCFFLFSCSTPCFLFHFVFVSFYYYLCLSCSPLPSSQNNITFYLSFLFYFSNPTLFSPQFISPLSSTVYFFWLTSLFLLFYSSFAFHPEHFYIVLFYDFFASFLSLKLCCLFGGGVHFLSAPGQALHKIARNAFQWLIETCVSKLLMFTEALYCR